MPLAEAVLAGAGADAGPRRAIVVDPLLHQARLGWPAKVMGEFLRFQASLVPRLPERRPPGERSAAADDGSALLCSNIGPTVTPRRTDARHVLVP